MKPRSVAQLSLLTLEAEARELEQTEAGEADEAAEDRAESPLTELLSEGARRKRRQIQRTWGCWNRLGPDLWKGAGRGRRANRAPGPALPLPLPLPGGLGGTSASQSGEEHF